MAYTIRELLQQANQLPGPSEETRREVEILLAYCLQKPRSYLFTWPERSPAPEEKQHFSELLKARQAGTPIAYLTGQRDFWTFRLKVNKHTLIPRPETELLVEQTLEKIPREPNTQVLDLGTGSGAIALALAKERPNAMIWACDFSQAALLVAQENAKQYQLTNIRFLHSDWFQAIPKSERFDVIVSNPPYIASSDIHLQQGDLRFEPQTALASGTEGLDAIRHLITRAPAYLKTDGWFFVEHGYDQKLDCQQLLQANMYRHIQHRKDLAGQERLSFAQAPL